MFKMSAGCNACAIHWSRCQSLSGPDGPISHRHAGTALLLLWSRGACTHSLAGSPTSRTRPGSDPDCSAATERAEWKKIWEEGLLLKHEYIGFQISQGSVATQLRWGGILYNWSIENFLRNLTVKELWKSVFISWSYDQKTKWLFFRNTVYLGL